MSNPVAVKWFYDSMAGAGGIAQGYGTLLSAVLDKCLVDGFGSVTLSSLVVSGGVATATVDTGHGFIDFTVVLVAGATPSGLNGEKRITVTGANTFTFDATGISNQTATGTITAKMAPLGWEKVYSGTHKAFYRPQDITGTRRYYGFDDSYLYSAYGYYAAVIGYESMSDIDTGTNPFPASAFSLFKHYSNQTSPWFLVGDGSAFYLIVWLFDGIWSHAHFFGDIVSNVPDDLYRAAIISNDSYNGNNFFCRINNAESSGHALCRNALGSVGSVPFAKFSSSLTPTNMGAGGVPYPNRADNGLLMAPVYLNESGNIRGALPGCYSPLHNTSLPHGLIATSDVGLTGRKLISSHLYANTDNTARAVFDITGPWR